LVNRLGFTGALLLSLPHQPAALSGGLILTWIAIQAGLQSRSFKTTPDLAVAQQQLYSLDGALALALCYRWGHLHPILPPGLLLGLLGIGLAGWAHWGPGRQAEQRHDGLWIWALVSWTLAADSGLAERLPQILKQHAAGVKASIMADVNRGGSAARTFGRA
jgi:hypothetical protein